MRLGGMKIQTFAALILALQLVAACSTGPERPEPPEGFFATHIDEDGTRKFQYTINMADDSSKRGNGRPGNMAGHVTGSSSRGVAGGVSAGSGGRGGKPPHGSTGGYQRFQQINEELERQLEQELAKSGFCEKGHRETERVVEPTMVYIRGECTDKAHSDQPL